MAKWFVFLVASVLAGCMSILLMMGYLAASGATNGGLNIPSVRFIAPGSQQVRLPDVGTYCVYFEYKSSIDSVDYSRENIPYALRITVHGMDSSLAGPVKKYEGVEKYSAANRAGISLLEFDVDTPGMFTLTASYEEGQHEPSLVLAVGPALTTSSGAAAGIAVFAGSFICFLAIIVAFRKKLYECAERRCLKAKVPAAVETTDDNDTNRDRNDS